jgi:hypothetical protein
VITKQIVGFKVYTLEIFGGNFDQNHAREDEIAKID